MWMWNAEKVILHEENVVNKFTNHFRFILKEPNS